MIDKILEITRASTKETPNRKNYYFFDLIIAHLKDRDPTIKIPELKIVFSINRLCETISFKEESYVIYDQYLGQTFNKFNRLIFHEDEEEAKAYLCKLMAEEYYLNNEIKNCGGHYLFYQINRKAKASDLPPDFIIKKMAINMFQESFVLLHEIGHSAISQKMLDKAMSFLEENDQAKRITEGFYQFSEQNFLLKNHFEEELACDLFAIDEILLFFCQAEEANVSVIIEAILLAFLYIRTVIDIKIKVSKNVVRSGASFNLYTKLRYNLLRAYCEQRFHKKLRAEKIYDPVDLYERWEKKIDMNIVTFLTPKLKKKLYDIVKNNSKINLEFAMQNLNIKD